MVGHRPLEAGILVRVQAPQHFVASAPRCLRPFLRQDLRPLEINATMSLSEHEGQH